MGGGASKALPPPVDLSGLPHPVDKGNGDKFYYAVPQDENLKRKGDQLILEVGPNGLRLLKPANESPVDNFPWGQIHSWAHTSSKFTFRYFHDGKKTIIPVTLLMRDVSWMLEHIQITIERILEERRSSAIPEEEFASLMEQLNKDDAAMKLDYLKTVAKMNYFTAEQGRQVLEKLHTPFDKIEAAVLLHGRLIDQNNFSFMLEDLDCQEDKDNVWHRIGLLKKQSSKISPTKPN